MTVDITPKGGPEEQVEAMQEHSSAETQIIPQDWSPEAVRPVGAWVVAGVVLSSILVIWVLVSLIFLHRA
ncbi:hypothetical protein J2D73_09370 [Acetobacter sacchari]|uniref:Uncharacterized protein n=1 Tax=Acetobacter sacchari TaxID=2661687 RepID=A0ABS3LVT1_9PROT|nr:hypothetical protein [Acetobacter sacchari]MBO1360003.1 hypothetical protein [Acetobacter sacchari]